MSKRLKMLRDERANVLKAGQAAIVEANEEMEANSLDAWSDAANARVNALTEKREDLDKAIAKAEAQADAERAFEVVGAASIGGGDDRSEDDPMRGWKSAGEFFSAVIRAGQGGGSIDMRLGAAPTTFGNESAGADGGYLVPVAVASRIHEHALEEDAFLPLTDSDPVSGNAMTYPRDETTPWGTTGVRAYWEAEGAQGNQTKPAIGNGTLRLNKLFALVPLTDELIQDSVTLESHVERKVGESIRWKTNDAIVNGTGVGKPRGIVNASAQVSQAKETSQAADTIVAANVAKMFARNTNPGRAVWLVNPDAFPQLPLMTIGDQPVWTAPNQGIQGAPAGLLMGRPVFMTDTCQTLGDKNDIQFVDFQGYKTITKGGGIQTATSMHLWFDYDVQAFRATFRVDGEPWLTSAVTPPNSSVTRSPFVTLNARA